MKTFYLHGDMAKDFCEKIDLNVDTINEFFNSLSSNFSHFRKYFINKSLQGVQYIFIDENKDTLEHYCYHLPLKSSSYHVMPVIEGAAGADIKDMGISFLQNGIMGYAMQTLVSKLKIIEDDGTPEYEKITTNSFIYQENENTIEQGSPIPVVYGQLRVGSKVINSTIHNYDYNYDEAEIYKNNQQYGIFGDKGGTLVNPNEIIDYREDTEENFKFYAPSAKDPTKRTTYETAFEDGRNKNKIFNPSSENADTNYIKDSSKNKELKIIGPSIDGRRKIRSTANASWWDHANDDASAPERVTLWGYGIDKNMRPSSKNDKCIETISIDGFTADKNHGYKGSNSIMTVGDRGRYQKLESISIYKTIEILSEGPIVGLAVPIDGFDKDSGAGIYPYSESSSAISNFGSSSARIKIEPLKFNPTLKRLTSYNNSSTLKILSAGNYYKNLAGDSTFTATVTAKDSNSDLYIHIDVPKSLDSADIGVTQFEDKERTADGENNIRDGKNRLISSNEIFMLREQDGKLTFNTNSDGSQFQNSLDSKYLQEETFTYNSASVTTGVMNLRELSESEDIDSFFYMGQGYDPSDLEYRVQPNNQQAILKYEYGWNSISSRVAQATVFDAANIFSNTDFISEDLDYIRNQYANSNANKFLDTLDWDKVPRIHYDGSHIGDHITNTTANQVLNIKVGSLSIEAKIGRRIKCGPALFNVYLRVTVSDYIYNGTFDYTNFVCYETNNINSTSYTVKAIRDDDRIKRTLSGCANFIEWTYSATFTANSTIKDDDYSRLEDFQKKDITNFFHQNNWNDIVLGISTDSVHIVPYISASIELSNLFNSAIKSTVSGVKTTTFNGRSFLHFGVGCGSSLKPNDTINNIPKYMYASSCDNFDSVFLQTNGSITYTDESGEEQIDGSKGFYHPLLFPRVTVFVVRANQSNGNISVLPTKIEAVANVTSNGHIGKLHLLHVPDKPVYDTNLDEWTPIQPFYNTFPYGRYSNTPVDSVNSSTYYLELDPFYDSAIIVRIDPSSQATNLNLRVEGSGFKLKSEDYRLNSNIETNFVNHIMHNKPRPSTPASAAGIFADVETSFYNDSSITLQKSIVLEEDNTNLKFDTSKTTASIKCNLESINLNNTEYKKTSLYCQLANAAWSYICTGRPTSAWVSSKGSGYTRKNGDSASSDLVMVAIYPREREVSSLTIDDKGAGYRPNSKFVINGIDIYRSHFHSTDPVRVLSTLTFKALCIINENGRLDQIKIIDKGHGYVSNLIYPYMNTAIFAFAVSRGMTIDLSSNIFPQINFPKNDLVLRVASEHLKVNNFYGSIFKFYIHEEGYGFISNQTFDSPFDIPSLLDVQFSIEVTDGSLTSISILGDKHPGYTESDSEVRLRIPGPDVPPPDPTEPITSETNAWARAIFLNDSPIRDKKGFFNYSKFHFDMRIGHIENGSQNPISKAISSINFIDDQAENSLMQKEFRYPSMTKTIDYPLYGPRNNGEMDYYYTHTIKNPNVSAVIVSINLKELHYIYEGDESNLYVNLSPIILLACMFYLVQQLAATAAEALSSSVLFGYASVSTGVRVFVPPCAGTGSGMGFGGGPASVVNPGPGVKTKLILLFTTTIIALFFILLAEGISKLTLKCSTIPFLCFKVGSIIKNSGEIWPAQVYIDILYGLEGETLTHETIAFRGCATNDYIKDIPIGTLPPAKVNNSNNFKNRIIKVYRSTREVDPVRQGIVEARYKIKASLHSITEYVDHFLSFPNTAIIGTRINSKDHPSIPNREYVIKGRIIKVPSSYDPQNGLYESNWNGKFVYKWTSNPAWIIYDLLTNERYGMGKYGITENQIDKWSFYQFSQYCDERVDTVIDGVTNSGTPYQERRHMCNLYVDTESEAYEYIKQLLSIYSSSINFSGNKIYISYDKSVSDDEIVMVFTNSNVQEDGFNYSSTPSTARVTAVTVDYRDERDNYMAKSEYVEDAAYIAEHGYSHIKIPGIGITRKGEAHRLAWQKILTQQLEREVIEFTAGLQASYLKIGDVIEVADNNKMANHYGGTILEVINNRTIKIDIPASILNNATSLKLSLPNTNYDQWDSSAFYSQGEKVYSHKDFLLYIKVNNDPGSLDPSIDLDNWSLLESSQEKQFIEYTISSRNGFEVTFNTDLNTQIQSGSTWIAVDSSIDDVSHTKPYRIKSIKETSNMIFQIIGVEYVQDKYDFVEGSSSNSSSAVLLDQKRSLGPDGNQISF